MITLLDIAPVAQQIKNNAPAFGGRVHEAIIAEDFEIEREMSPAAFVFLSSDKSSPNETLTLVRQQVFSYVTVAIVARRQPSRTDRAGTVENQLIRTLRQEVFNAILGQVIGDLSAIEHVAGSLHNRNETTLQWRDQFLIESYIAN